MTKQTPHMKPQTHEQEELLQMNFERPIEENKIPWTGLEGEWGWGGGLGGMGKQFYFRETLPLILMFFQATIFNHMFSPHWGHLLYQNKHYSETHIIKNTMMKKKKKKKKKAKGSMAI